jgi:hypothetical protein
MIKYELIENIMLSVCFVASVTIAAGLLYGIVLAVSHGV